MNGRLVDFGPGKPYPWPMLKQIFCATLVGCLTFLPPIALAQSVLVDRDVEAPRSLDDIEFSQLQYMALLEGDPDVQFQVGLRLELGTGIPQDMERAVYMYTYAAKQGHVDAQWKLALAAAKGDGIAVDKIGSSYWAEKAARQGHGAAQQLYALSFTDTALESPDFVSAHVWMHMADLNGVENAGEYLAKIEETLTDAEILTAKDLGQTCFASNYVECG